MTIQNCSFSMDKVWHFHNINGNLRHVQFQTFCLFLLVIFYGFDPMGFITTKFTTIWGVCLWFAPTTLSKSKLHSFMSIWYKYYFYACSCVGPFLQDFPELAISYVKCGHSGRFSVDFCCCCWMIFDISSIFGRYQVLTNMKYECVWWSVRKLLLHSFSWTLLVLCDLGGCASPISAPGLLYLPFFFWSKNGFVKYVGSYV